MSTRANIVINFGESRVWVYNHHDGYPEYRLHHLMDMLQEVINTNEELGRQIEKCDDKMQQGWRKYWWCTDTLKELSTLLTSPNEHGYELTAKRHGDIEYLYEFVGPTSCESFEEGNEYIELRVWETSYDETHDQLYKTFKITQSQIVNHVSKIKEAAQYD